MADRQSPGQPPEEPAPEALSLLAFAKSLYHGERADNFFKFLPSAQLLKPPRMLLTPHIMGRPLGLPDARETQRATILAALRLLETAANAPTLEVMRD